VAAPQSTVSESSTPQPEAPITIAPVSSSRTRWPLARTEGHVSWSSPSVAVKVSVLFGAVPVTDRADAAWAPAGRARTMGNAEGSALSAARRADMAAKLDSRGCQRGRPSDQAPMPADRSADLEGPRCAQVAYAARRGQRAGGELVQARAQAARAPAD